MPVKTRVPLYLYSYSLAYLNHKQINKETNHVLLNGSDKQVKDELVPLLSVELNASSESLLQAFRGEKKPLQTLFLAANDIGAGEKLKRYLVKCQNQLEYPEHKISKLKQSHVKKAYVHKAIKPAKKSKPVSRSKHASVAKKKKVASVPENRLHLLDYISALCYLQNTTIKAVAQTMGYTCHEMVHGIQRDDEHSLEDTLLGELPFTIQIAMKNIKAIIHKNNQPMEALTKDCLNRVIDRQTLAKCFYALSYLHHIKPSQLDKATSDSLKVEALKDSREKLAKVLAKVCKRIDIETDIKKLLIKANVRSGGHAYTPRMYFRIDYRVGPVGLTQSDKEHDFDKRKVAKHLEIAHQLASTQGARVKKISSPFDRRRMFGRFKKMFTWQIWKILTAWNYMYGFSDSAFIANNFKDYQEKYIHTSVLQDKAFFKIKDANDWFVILKKLKEQLDAVRDAFDLKAVSDSVYGKYSYMKEYGCLAYPRERHYRKFLAELADKHVQFTGKFAYTGIAHLGPNDSQQYLPIMMLTDVKKDGKPATRQIWLNYGKNLQKIGKLQEGDLIQFSATPRKYWSGHYGKNSIKRANYKLSNPTNVSLLQEAHIRTPQSVPKTKKALIGFCIANHKSAGYDFSVGDYRYIRECMQAYSHWKIIQQTKD